MQLSVGQRVVCVNDRIAGADGCYRSQTLPKAGRLYTVRAVVPYTAHGYDEDGVDLVEIVNRPRRWRTPTGGWRRPSWRSGSRGSDRCAARTSTCF
jgi:hypothetical protein